MHFITHDTVNRCYAQNFEVFGTILGLYKSNVTTLHNKRNEKLFYFYSVKYLYILTCPIKYINILISVSYITLQCFVRWLNITINIILSSTSRSLYYLPFIFISIHSWLEQALAASSVSQSFLHRWQDSLDWGSARRKAANYTQNNIPQNKRTQTSLRLSGIRTYDRSVRASEDSSCRRQRGHCDRPSLYFICLKLCISFIHVFQKLKNTRNKLLCPIKHCLEMTGN
jgi:hypothetical protein